jgi:hypothetical protein
MWNFHSMIEKAVMKTESIFKRGVAISTAVLVAGMWLMATSASGLCG